MARSAKKKKNQIQITLIKSPIGYSKRQKDTVRALGLCRINQTVVKEDSDAIQGMLDKVSHLVAVEEKE
ncbi:MAG: 50S ribosomal protein L30 [Anaerolineales bacterium]|jgi:large subunit ribosomal protein L30